MTDESAAEQINREQRRRHAHNPTQPVCRDCGSFVSMPAPEGNRVRYYCGHEKCEEWKLEYVEPQKQATRS